MDPPTTITHSSVVFKDHVLIYTLKYLEMHGADVWNDTLNVPTSENAYSIAGSQFGAEGEGQLGSQLLLSMPYMISRVVVQPGILI